MCGIAGLFAKDPAFEQELGRHFAPMMLEMTDRGPDSAGFAVYRDAVGEGEAKLTALSRESIDWKALAAQVEQALEGKLAITDLGDHAVMRWSSQAASLESYLREEFPHVEVLSSGQAIEIFKQKGLPEEAVSRFEIDKITGSHALGHTRMATESAVTTAHSHPFSTGDDLCLVHNGSLSNHNRLRIDLEREGVHFATDNDSEVAAGYLTLRLRQGDSIEQALTHAIDDLDGFYTFAVGTREGFSVLRDPIACKPAVIAETDTWVAMASEYRAIARLPGASTASMWEPEPGRVYSWGR